MSDHQIIPDVNRRDALASAAGVAAGLLMMNEVLAADNPAAQVGDKTSTIKITSIKTFPVGSRVFIKMETNHGITGWGEISQLPPTVSVPLVNSIFELLDGENPTRIEHLWQKIYRAHRDIRGGAFMVHTLAGIDMALWDITGKLWGVPVYRILGGPCRDKIRMYPTPKANKVGTGGPHPFSGNPPDIQNLVNAIANARKSVGPDGTVMFDAHCAVPPPMLIQLAAAIQPFDVLFIEEPAVPGNIEVFKRLKQAIKIPLATGERDRTIWEVLPYLHEGCIDILQPDCAHGGGITALKKIATLAEAYFVPLAPHSVATFLGVTASLHLTATVPYFLIHEFYPQDIGGSLRKNWEVDKEGNASLPQGPGLGIEVDEALLVKAGADPVMGKYKWPVRVQPDGSVTDY